MWPMPDEPTMSGVSFPEYRRVLCACKGPPALCGLSRGAGGFPAGLAARRWTKTVPAWPGNSILCVGGFRCPSSASSSLASWAGSVNGNVCCRRCSTVLAIAVTDDQAKYLTC